jgi:hypothetical protein
MSTVTAIQLVRKLRSPDNRVVLKAVEDLRARGWLSDGSLEAVNLRHIHLQRADLYRANLQKVNLHMADLRGADLSMANLQDANLCGANLHRADLSAANLQGANLYTANLQGARNVSDGQLAQASRLRGATMPDGSPYDGRFNLAGDFEAAQYWHIDIDDPEAMAEFYGVFVEDYLCGQDWAQDHVPSDLGKVMAHGNDNGRRSESLSRSPSAHPEAAR